MEKNEPKKLNQCSNIQQNREERQRTKKNCKQKT